MSPALIRIELADDRDPWDRQPGESDDQYQLFVKFRDLGRARTIERLATLTAKPKHRVRRLAQARRWLERTRAWDTWQTHLIEQERIEGREKATRLVGKAGQQLVGRVLERAAQTQPGALSPGDVSRWLASGVQAMEHAYGRPTDFPSLTDVEDTDTAGVHVVRGEERSDEEKQLAYAAAIERLTQRASATAASANVPLAERTRAADLLTRLAQHRATPGTAHDDADVAVLDELVSRLDQLASTDERAVAAQDLLLDVLGQIVEQPAAGEDQADQEAKEPAQ